MVTKYANNVRIVYMTMLNTNLCENLINMINSCI